MESQSDTQVQRKRDREEFEALGDLEEPCSVPADFMSTQKMQDNNNTTPSPKMAKKEKKAKPAAEESLPTPPVGTDSARNVEVEMHDVKSEDGESPSPSASTSTPTVYILAGMNAAPKSTSKPPTKTAQPANKRIKLTPEEKAQKERDLATEKARKERDIAAEKAQKAAEKALKDAEKAQKAADKAQRDAEKARKEAEKAAKEKELAEEKAQKAAEKARKDAEKEADKKKKEAEKAAKEEEKKKADRAQLKLGNFFTPLPADRVKGAKKTAFASKLRTSMSPAPSSTSDAEPSTPNAPEILAYNAIFSDFFLKDETELAPFTRFERDEEATEVINKTLDSYLSGDRSPDRERGYDPVSLYHLSKVPKRGRRCMPVREIMDEITGRSSRVIDLTTDSQNSQIMRSRDKLKHVPMKLIQFQEDVRPPYRGTYTSRPLHGIENLARNPFRRDLPNTNYDYDSEAEWVDDGEDAEDLNSEVEIDDEDDDEDMDDFLDDENDESAHARRLVLQGDLEPVSTGLCWEDKHKRNTNVKMMPYRMEVILDPKLKSIDPLSTSYWESSPKAKSMPPPRVPLNAMNPPNTKPAKNASVKSFFTPASDLTHPTPLVAPQSTSKTSVATDGSSNPKKLIPEADMPAFRAAIQGSKLSKVGLIETLKVEFPGRGATAISDTLMHIAHKAGKKRAEQRWVLNEPDDA